jgi:hypothetical protein
MSTHRARAASSAAPVDAGISQEDAGFAASAVNAPAQPPEAAPPETFCTLVWMQEDLDERLVSDEGKLTQGAGGRRLSELFFVSEIES